MEKQTASGPKEKGLMYILKCISIVSISFGFIAFILAPSGYTILSVVLGLVIGACCGFAVGLTGCSLGDPTE